MHPPLRSLVIYTRHMAEMRAFYTDHFGYEAIIDPADRIVELRAPSGGVSLMLHPAGKGQKMGQALVKLVFAVPQPDAARAALIAAGVAVGPVHEADGYAFANLKDPSGNSVSISSRAFRATPGSPHG